MGMSLGPKVTFISPLPARDPNTDELITEPTVKVACKVERATRSGAPAVDKTMVKIGLQLVGEDDKETWLEPPVNAAADDTFEAQFEVHTLSNGPLRFRCVARDLATVPNTTTARLDTLLDRGPTIEIEEPSKPSYALKAPVAITFKVEASPVSEADTEAAVDKVRVLVSGVEIEVEEDSATPGLYQTSVDFGDRSLFPIPPTSSQISISATNKRSPTAAVRSSKVDIVIDGQGPSIIVKAPLDGEIVHGKRTLSVEVTDPSGVNASSLVANFNQGLIVIRDWDGTAPSFFQSFDTSEYTTLTRLTVVISATDAVGNDRSVSLTLKLDNLPPVISLTPPLIREWRKNGERYECSSLFDPVGDDVPNDGETRTGGGYFRVLVEDRTNKPITGPNDPEPVTYIAGVKADTVELFMQRDVSIPLLVDAVEDEDEICDEIARTETFVKLSPITPTGLPWYKLYDSSITDPEVDNNASCFATTAMTPPVTQPTHPANVCRLSPMHRVVPARSEGRPPGVYALRPTNNANGECTGEYWELYMIADPGWICLAVRAEDTIGNIGVSQPVRLCYGDNPDMTPDCSAMPMPSCTDGCTISAAQKFQHTEGAIEWYFP